MKDMLRYLYHYWLSRGGRYGKRIRVVTLEVSALCNLKCVMCGVPHLKRTKGLMALDDFKRIAAKLPKNLELLKLAYAGEPLLNRDVFAMIRHYRAAGGSARVRISTNGVCLPAFDPEEILTSGVDQIDVAIEGACAKTHEDYRRGSDFEAVCGGIKKLCAEKKRLKLDSPKIVQMTLLSKKSVPELAEIKKMAVALGVDELHLRYMAIPGLGKKESDLKGSVYGYISEEQRRNWAGEYAAEWPCGLYEKRKSNYRIIGEMRHCSSFLTPMVYYNGDVSICCFDGEGAYTFGNLLKEDFETVASRMPAKAVFGRKLPLCRSCVISRKGMNLAEIDCSRSACPPSA
jgi:MoaA/NifB/PqqE/SkfB family radical SAM enzyme